jgi:MFS superfamily sulfate permease-like transporter
MTSEMEEEQQDVKCYASSSMLSRSFERGGRFLRNYEPDAKWVVVSPMTQHVIQREIPTPPLTLRRQRSRSFNDYIEDCHISRSADESTLLLPRLKSEFEKRKFPSTTSQQRVLQDGGFPEIVSGNPIYINVLYGLINATIVLPVLMSFGNIIYQNEAFAPYMPVLIKLTLVSGVVHQVCFSSLSSLKFAVGSVQDAGLIFLSAMATDMVSYCRSRGFDDETMLATVTVCLGIATSTLGFGLIIVGRLKLAGYVQLLPTCVIAGYLAFIGFFCGKSGVSLMAGTSELTLSVVSEKFNLILPGIVGGLFIYASVRTLKHVAVLPISILLLLLLFYSCLMLSGSSVEQATKDGWIREGEKAPIWYHTWDYLQFDKVAWSVLPRLLLSEMSMIVVVALSSSLDVAAIELEMKTPLNYNKELMMVGVSNMISGLTGGYTGSYIFSQSIFSLRSGIQDRLAGVVLASCQIAVIVTPFPVLAYVPNFFYGALLLMICIDLLYEWLWELRDKVTTAEYILGLSTFGLIQILQVEYGILAGVILYIFCRQCGINVGELKDVIIANDDKKSSNKEPSMALTL